MKHLLLTTIAAVLVVGCGNPDRALLDASEKQNIEGVKQHLAAGADVNAKDEHDWTPLHNAVFWGHKEIAELLITAGADVNAAEWTGMTPLHQAVSRNKEIAKLLIAAGADVNAKDKLGDTPLQVAAYQGHKEIAELFIANGADVNAKTVYGNTPLDLAKDKSETADLLRKHGGKTRHEL